MREEDKEFFIQKINENRLKMYKTAIAILKDEDDANDAIQEALYSAYKNYYSLREKSYFTTWIIKILINKCCNIINKNKKIAYIDDTVIQNTASSEDNYEIENSLEWVLNQIDKELKEIVVLYYYDDFSVADIANVVDIPQGTIKSRLSRAREQIKEIIKKEEGEFNG